MKTIHLISHTHWDREWYRTFQQFRLRLVHLVDGLLDILEHDRGYKHFMLDGQTIVLDDYLQMRPEAEPTLKRLIQSRRLLIGPWHILPDMFLVSPEAHIRNLLAGDREARRFGPKMMIGYMPDSFGHIGQMPQILRGFGIDNACLWRGLDDQPAEFWWQAPDGTRVLMLYMRDSYANGAGLAAGDPAQFTEQIKQVADSLASHSSVSALLVMFGNDHMEPEIETSAAIKAAKKQLEEYRILHSTLPNYLEAVQSDIENQKIELPVVTGELRSSKRSHLLPGVLSTRIWIKQRNQACENLLEKWAEPFSTFASLVKTDKESPTALRHSASIVRQAWMLLMQNHPHDSICGCSIDQVHEEMRSRFDQVDQIGNEIVHQSLETIAAQVDTENHALETANPKSCILVFNPLSSARTDIVAAEISLPLEVIDFEFVDDAGNVIPHQSTNGEAIELANFLVTRHELDDVLDMIHEGRAGNLAMQEVYFHREGATLHVETVFAENAPPRLDVWETGLKTFGEYLEEVTIETFHFRIRLPDSTACMFVASDVPALGWKTFYIRVKEFTSEEIHITPLMRWLMPLASVPFTQRFLTRLLRPKTKPPYIIENEFLIVELNINDRTLTMTDKQTGKIYRGLNHFVDGGDCGDEYNFSPPPTDLRIDSAKLNGVTIKRGDVQQKMIVSLMMSVPIGLSDDRKSRSKEKVELPITTTVTLIKDAPRADIHTHVNNRARDHRLRVHFPTSMQGVASAEYDGHFEVVKRPIGIPTFDDTWVEEPRPETHQRAFTSVADDKHRLTIANRGLPEVGVTSDAEIAITLLRCVGWLSRDDFSTRKDHAGPFLETPKGQILGDWDFDYSIIVADKDLSAYQQAWNFASPMQAVTTDIHVGSLPQTSSFITVDTSSFVLSAVKETEDGRGWIVRGYNIRDEEIPVTITPWRRFKKAKMVNMAEEILSKLKVGRGGEVNVQARGHEVVTIMFSD